MFQKSNLEDSVELWGECFSRSKFGLNEEQVKAFIGRLISEREILLERDKQYKTLALKAEKITLDADIAANEIRLKAEEKAQSQSRVILEAARKRASELIEEKRVEAETIARKEAEAITANAYAEARKCISEAEEEASVRAKAIIMKALKESNRLIEQKRVEAENIAIKEVDLAKADILADAQRRLKKAEEEAESEARAQAHAILFSKKNSRNYPEDKK